MVSFTVKPNYSLQAHIDMLCIKLKEFMLALKRLRRSSCQTVALTACFGYVSSVLRYGFIICENSTNFNKTYTVKKKCLRAVSRVWSFTSCTLF